MDLSRWLKKRLPTSVFELIRYYYSGLIYINNRSLFKDNVEFRGIAAGGSVYIIGSGPSIKEQDLSLLRGKDVIVLNNGFVLPGYKEAVSNGRAYHLVAPIHPPQTESEWLAWLSEMELAVPLNVTMVFGLNARKLNIRFLCEKHGLFKKHNVVWYFVSRRFNYYKKNAGYGEFDKSIIVAGAASVYGLLWANYLGNNKAYLLGMDHDYFLYDNQADMRAYKSATHQNNEIQRVNGDRFYVDEYLRQFHVFERYLYIKNFMGIKVFNCSPKGVLKIFPRVAYPSVIEES